MLSSVELVCSLQGSEQRLERKMLALPRVDAPNIRKLTVCVNK